MGTMCMIVPHTVQQQHLAVVNVSYFASMQVAHARRRQKAALAAACTSKMAPLAPPQALPRATAAQPFRSEYIPFAFLSVLHLYETLGWWRAGAGLRKIHFAEEWNEMHHLQIMESLGGDSLWLDRFMAQHGAILYYWVLIGFFFLFPSLAYKFGELVEVHAADTYAEFVDANEELLKQLPPPAVALEYYKGDDLYMFDDFQTSKRVEPRRPPCDNLFDVFSNIRDDELEHVKTMVACEDNSISADIREKNRSNMKKIDSPKMSGNAA